MTKNIHRQTLALAIPNILSNISVPLLSSVDTALMGGISEVHLGAVGLAAMIFNFLYWSFGFLRMGTTGMIAQSYGEENQTAILFTLLRALLVAFSLSLFLFFIQTPLADWSFYWMNVSAESRPLVQSYFDIRLLAAPASFGLYALMGFFFGMQNVYIPLLLTIVINLVNMLASYYLVQQLGWGVEGVAWGTVWAQYTGLLLALCFVLGRYGYLRKFYQVGELLQAKALGKFFTLNAALFLRSFFLMLAFAFFYSQSSKGGEELLAINTILLQLLNWLSFGVDGFAYAAESLVGKYVGAKDRQGVRDSVRACFLWGMGMAGGYMLLFVFAGEELLAIFSQEEALLLEAKAYLPFLWALPLIATPSYLWDGIFVGLTRSKAMRNSMGMALLLYLCMYYGLEASQGNRALWWAFYAFFIVRALGLQYAYLKAK